jgi:general secretion pathway protein D
MTVTGFFVRRRMRLAAWAALLTVAGTLASAQQAPQVTQTNGQRITLNFKDADIIQIADAVSAATGRTLLLDPRVRAQVTMLSNTPMAPDALWEAFLSILQVHNFVAMPAANGVWKVVPDANARSMPGEDLPDRVNGQSDEIVTQVVQVRNVNAAQLVPTLRSLMPQNGHLAAYQQSNILIISDRAANVNRLMRIIRRIDQVGDSDVEIIPLQNASAGEVVRVLTTLTQQAQQEGAANPIRLVADDRSNSVLISGDPQQRLRIKTLVAHLDTPTQTSGNTKVRYLRYADAEKIAPKLKEQITGQAQAAPGAPGGATTPQAAADRATQIWAEPETNALVITAQPATMRQIDAIIDKLDIRRMQVLVEAIIADVNEDKTAELGVNWAVFSNDDDTRVPLGGFISPVGGSSLVDLARLVDDPEAAATAGVNVPAGTTLGIGRIANTGTNFAAMLRAIRSDGNTNIISTPQAITMDNQEAELKVAREVPFLTGSFSSTGVGGTNGAVNPFQTIQREEVGTILKVTPQLNGSNTVILKIELESSDLDQSASGLGAVDLITNKRTISTNVMVEDGGIVVLGGLISDVDRRGESRVPFLGRIPILGLAFKTRSGTAQKRNLMVFIRPKILRDGVETAFETDAKYNYMRDQQRRMNTRELLPILPGVSKPSLPEPPPPPPPGTGEVDPRVQQEKLGGGQGDATGAREDAAQDAVQSQGTPPAQPQTQGAPPAPQATPAPAPEPRSN